MISNDDGKKNTENKRKLCSLEFSHGDEVRIIIIFNLIRFISHKMQQQKNNYIYISLVSFFSIQIYITSGRKYYRFIWDQQKKQLVVNEKKLKGA